LSPPQSLPFNPPKATTSRTGHVLNARNIRICHININSITSSDRLDELNNFTKTNNTDILMLTETKLDSNIHPILYRVDDFQAPFTQHRNRHGGGIAIYSHNTISATRVRELEMEEEECIWIKIKIKSVTFLACCIYLPPNLNLEHTQDFLTKLTESILAAPPFFNFGTRRPKRRQHISKF